ncbi:Complement C3 Complement C3 beta chain Complement C3 alpha chain [Larimichthys crocea]|uniref:Complement C3 Complement C3 beta chain Complement C3 alpha chain n=1 Tax=Larimichthys crocea TaxID=215358 RepID=A0A6G0JBH4_LARCR|nr:Complement C3 Complement C3 beta chain Complement C3 alpha chain [Larimichthys crocea]
MGSRRSTQLWLLVFLAFFSVADVYSVEVMSAPNVLRVGTQENIFVDCQTCSDGDTVEIKVMNHPTKDISITSTSVSLTATKKFQDLVQIKIPAGRFSKDRNVKQYVYLQAKFPHVELEKVVLVSFQSDYIFIQTDKTLYTPNSKVHYRIFALTPGMKALDRNVDTDAYVVTEIVNPNGIVFPLEQVSLTSGMHSGQYNLNEIASPGLWKVVAKFPSTPKQSYSAEFEVKEYVLPSFEVKLASEDSFFHVNSPNITINIKAEYLFGEEVDGMAYVVFGVMQDDKKNSFPSSLQRVEIKSGIGSVTLQKEHITQIFPNILDLVGRFIYVAVSVLTESGSEMVEAELRGIQIVTSPYTIHFRRTPKYFKPGMTFEILVEVLNPDGTPAPHVTVEVDPGKQQSTTSPNGMARFIINTDESPAPLYITADVPGMSQASANMVAHPYTSSSRSYIHIGLDQADIKLGSHLKVSFYLSQQNNLQGNTTYLILSRGQLVKYGQYMTRTLTAMTLLVTKEMLPSFRIVAYYFTKNNEVVADSLWVDVKDTCMGSLQLEAMTAAPSYRPGKMFHLKVTGDPGATVALVAVDKGVYVLNNKHRLTQKKVWDLVEKSDTGCTPGGGRDSMSVFYDAGLLFESNTASGTPYRLEYICPTPSRRKRANNILDVRTSLVSQFEEKIERQCCLEGMRETLLSYSCERRSEYIIDGPDCVNAFLHCCKQMEIQRAERKHTEDLILARSEEDENIYIDSNTIVSRSSFPESWLWTKVMLPSCQKNSLNCRTTTNEIHVPLKDSITTWQLTGISISRTHGICVGEPLEVKVLQDFFIDLRLPYSAVRGEQIEIKAILHNYESEKVTVRVELIETQDVCSSASKRKRYRQEVEVGAKTTLSVPFIIIPMKEGHFPIEVKAAVKDSWSKDGVKKTLKVVPPGILTTSLKIITLNPAKEGEGGKQETIINSEIPMKDMAPNTPEWTYISVTGREQISALVEKAISGKSMGSLIKQPSGCGEQNMISMTLPVIATTYLDKTNQWEIVGFDKRKEALEHIKTGYQNELHYRKKDGGFAVFPEYKSSTWLTAYVAKVFAMANSLVKVSNDSICEAIKFLISETQNHDGSFREVGSIIHGEMVGDVKGADSDVSMTAFCLIAIQESRAYCNDTVENFKDGIDKAVAYLERRQHNLNNSYAAAMTSYALANENKLDRKTLFKFISSELTHWPVHNAQLFTLEATGYALLALVKAKAFEDARPVVRWFNKQQIDGGGYGSTQATIMVYQAIAEYWINAHEEEYNVNVDIEIPGRSIPLGSNFNRQNHYGTKTAKFHQINKNVKVIASGTGEATVTMVSMYYALPKEKKSNCEKFNLSVELINPDKMDTVEKIYKLVIKVLYKNKETDATMSILDIGLLTGYQINTDDLNELSTGHSRQISKYEINKALSERGSLIIYLNKVSHTKPEEIVFRIHQKQKVGVLQPAAVSVYEYYNHQHNIQPPCMKFYHPERISGELLRLCQSSGCICAEENCSMQKMEKIDNGDRTTKACETEVSGRIDYVYRVRLENFTQSLATDIYTMRVVEVIKEGGYDECRSKKIKNCDVGPLGNLRPFLSYQHCRVALNMKLGKTYLVMGMANDIHKDEKKQLFQYILGERTWIEYWPTDAECQTKEHRPTCMGMEELVNTFKLFGCEQ